MRISRKTAAVIVAVTFVGALGVGNAVVASDNENSQRVIPREGNQKPLIMPDGRSAHSITPSWPKNEFGLTVGEPTFADQLAYNIPDLTAVTADNGKEGFVLNSESWFPPPKTREEAAEQTRAILNDDGEDVQTVYGPDGKIVLGTINFGKVTLERDGKVLNGKTGEVIGEVER